MNAYNTYDDCHERGYRMPKLSNAITEYRNYYLPPHFPVLLLTGDYWKISDIPSSRLHFHNCLEIGICHSDSGFMEIYGERYPFHEGDITIVPRNVPHTTYSSPGCASLWSYIFIDPNELFHRILPPSWKNYDLLPYFFKNFKYIISREQHPAIYQLVDIVIKELENEKLGYQLAAKHLLLSLYIKIYRLQLQDEDDIKESGKDFSDSSNPLSIAPALDYIENNYMQQFSIEFLAGLCHWSPTHFRRIFHSIMRISPLNYVNNTRIQKSCSLLCSTEESISSISEIVGFQSVSSYNRCFFRTMQQSPREYRRMMLQSDKQAQNTSVMEYSGWMYPEW